MSYEDFLNVQKELKNPPRTKTAKVRMKSGQEFSYKYADLPEILETVMPTLQKYGFVLYQPFSIRDGIQVLSTVLKKKEFVYSSDMIVPPIDDPQQYGALITYYRKYGVCTLLGVAADDDTDAQNVTSSKKTTSATAKSVTITATVNQPSKLPNFAPKEDRATDASNYMMPLGKYKGVKLKDMKRNDLSSWLDYMHSQDKVTPQVQEAMKMAESFLNQGSKQQPPEFNPLDEIPF